MSSLFELPHCLQYFSLFSFAMKEMYFSLLFHSMNFLQLFVACSSEERQNERKPKQATIYYFSSWLEYRKKTKKLNAQYLIADNQTLVSHMGVVKYQTFSCTAVHRMKRQNKRMGNFLKGRSWQDIMFVFSNTSVFAEWLGGEVGGKGDWALCGESTSWCTTPLTGPSNWPAVKNSSLFPDQ